MWNKLFVISAPSGTGKTTVLNRLMRLLKDTVLSVSATTRIPRKNEKDGKDYLFVTNDKFQEMIKNNNLLEWAKVHDAFYGTPKALVEKWLKDGKIIFFDIDVQGAKSIKKIFPGAVLIFLLPPSNEELVKRLTLRGANTEKELKLRIKKAKNEVKQKDFYDYQVINDDLDKTVEEVKDIIVCHCEGVSPKQSR